MGYYQDLLDQLMTVEKEGFNPYTESYTARIGQLKTIGADEGVDTPQTTPINEPMVTGGVTDAQYHQAWGNYGGSQALATQAFQDRYPDIDVAAILNEYKGRADFSNKDLDIYAKELNALYGEKTLTADEVNAGSPDYYKNLKTIKQKEQVDQTRGTKEKNKEEELWGWRNLLERRYKEGESPYKYLDEITDKEVMDEAKEKGEKEDKYTP